MDRDMKHYVHAKKVPVAKTPQHFTKQTAARLYFVSTPRLLLVIWMVLLLFLKLSNSLECNQLNENSERNSELQDFCSGQIPMEKNDIPKNITLIKDALDWLSRDNYDRISIFLFMQTFLFAASVVCIMRVDAESRKALKQDEGPRTSVNEIEIRRTQTSGHNRKEKVAQYLMLRATTEIICFLTILCYIILLDNMCEGHFIYLGIKLCYFNLPDSPLAEIFPTSFRCNLIGSCFKDIGPETICTLPKNTANYVVFIVVWYWFVTLIIVHVYQIVCTILLILDPFEEEIYE